MKHLTPSFHHLQLQCGIRTDSLTHPQITEHKYFFRNVQTGRVQWEHPDPGFHIELYQIPPRNDGVVPEYETVSYVWGEPARQKTIRVDTSNGSYAMKVTESLATVLRYLRRPQHTRRLWVDAICLDQDDHAELSRQVPRMRDIYNLAKKATLWLGIADSSSSHAMGRLRYLGDQVTAEADTGVLFPAPGADQDDWYDPTVPLPFPPQTWDAISDLLQRPWFHRLWVVQEIQPGAVVQCGHDQTPVTAITEAIYCMYSKRRLPRGLRRHLEQAVGTLARLPALAFTRLLYRVSTFKACTDPRDKIYGLLGLAPDKFASQMRVSYEESTSAADVFAQAFLNHALICQRLEHFHNCFTHTNLTEGAPSWVPDWWSNIPGETYIPAMFASGTSCAHFTYTSAVGEDGKERPTILRVRGKQCGIVTSTTEPLPPGLGQSEAIRRVRAWQPEDLDSSTYEPTGESTAKHTPSP